MHIGWVCDERLSRLLDVCDKKSDIGGGVSRFPSGCVS